MEPPSLQLYDNKTASVTSAKDFAAAHDYAVIKRFKETKVWLKCDRGKAYQNRYQLDENQRVQSIGSRHETFKQGLEAWELSVAEWNHIHKASHSISAHPSLRKLNATQSQDLEVMTNARQPPRVIRSLIQHLILSYTCDLVIFTMSKILTGKISVKDFVGRHHFPFQHNLDYHHNNDRDVP